MQMYDKQADPKNVRIPLNYAKIILAKVSFSKALFEKELKKAIALLLPHEVKRLEDLCYLHFEPKYSTILRDCFASPLAS